MRLLETAMILVLLGACGMASADPIDLKPFRATYTAEWKGITAAGSILELRRDLPDTYAYSSTSAARGLFRMAFSETLTQTSTFRVTEGHIVPLTFRGTDEKERPIDLTFDWQKMRVSGVAKGNPVDLEIPTGSQDPMSLQIESMRGLAAGAIHDKVWLVDSDKLKEYELHQEANARIDTALGQLDTLVYTSKRPGSDRVTRTWVAPALGYLPVKAQQMRGAKVMFTLLIESVDH
jgi:hypothetical protein